MYTDVSKFLKEIIDELERGDYPHAFKSRTLKALNYFHSQALSDLDRRVSQSELRKNWSAFQESVKGTKVLLSLSHNVARRHAIESFMGVASPVESYTPGLNVESKKSKFHGKETEHLIDHLVRKCNERPKLSEEQLVIIRFGLFYLHLEARRGRSQRDVDRIKLVWKVIQPMLRRAGFLDELDKDQSAVNRLRFFISNKFL